MSPGLTAALRIAFYTAALFWLQWQLAALSLIVVPVLWYIASRFARLVQTVSPRERMRRGGAVGAVAEEHLGSVPLVQAYGREDEAVTAFRRESNGTVNAELAASRIRALFTRCGPGGARRSARRHRPRDVGALYLSLASRTGQAHRSAGANGYRSPEQVRGANLAVATDVWGLGLLLHEALSGRQPGVYEVWPRLRRQQRLRRLPRARVGLVNACLDPRPAGRPSMTAMLDGLGGVPVSVSQREQLDARVR